MLRIFFDSRDVEERKNDPIWTRAKVVGYFFVVNEALSLAYTPVTTYHTLILTYYFLFYLHIPFLSPNL
jgi:hypothetical protein